MGVINLASEKAIENAVISVGDKVDSGFDRVVAPSNISKYNVNLYDKDIEFQDTQLNNGVPSTVSNWFTSNFIRIDKSIYPTLRIYLYCQSSVSTTVARISFYRADKSVLSNINNQDITGEVTIPDGAYYVRISNSAGSNFRGDYKQNRVIVVKYGCFSISVLDDVPDYIKYPSKDGNLFSKNNIVYGRLNTIQSNNYVLDAGGTMSCFIPVVAKAKYYAHTFPASAGIAGYNAYIFFFDNDKKYIGYSNRLRASNVIVTPERCAFVSWNMNDYLMDNFCGIIPIENEDTIGEKCADISDVMAFESVMPFSNIILLGIFEKYVAYKKYTTDTTIYIGLDGWKTTSWIELVISTAFDGATGVDRVVFFKKSGTFEVACLVMTSDNRIFTNSDSTFTTFTECNIWDMSGNKYWDANDNDKDPRNNRYRFHFPSDIATRQNAFNWHNGPVWLEGQSGQGGAGILFGNYSDNGHEGKGAGAQLYFTEDGVNIYVQYQFGIHQRYYKIAGNSEVQDCEQYDLGDDIDTTSFTGSITSVTAKVRYNIVPSDSEHNPTNIFDYEDAVAVSAISGKNFTVADGTNFRVGDTIILQGTATGDYEKLLNNDASATDGGNVCFIVKSIAGNVLQLSDAIGNPKNNLMCRHIHGVSEFGQGIVVYTGEEYPFSNIVYIMPYTRGESGNEDANVWITSCVNFTYSPNAFQRALGLYLRPDGKIIFITDSPNPTVNKLQVNGQNLKMSNYGLFIFDPSAINDANNVLGKIPFVCAGYALYPLGNILLYSDRFGKTYYSKDFGDTWNYICTDGKWKSDLLGFDKNRKRFFFGDGFVVECK